MQVVVIGAGIVGLHVARVCQEAGHEVFVLDKESHLGEHTSGRNSGVIHAGIFYKAGSLKETSCIEGNRLTYEWAEKLKVPHKPCGKWVVAEPGQENDLEPFFEKIRNLPIPTPTIQSASDVHSKEPHLRSTQAIFVPSTGIIDAADYVNRLAAYVEEQGVMIVRNCEVQEIGTNILKTSRDDINFELAINCAGLSSDDLAHQQGLGEYSIRPCRGDYYQIAASPLHRPVYHLPDTKGMGLGVHLTPTLDGQTLIGPNAFFIDAKEDYDHHTDDKTPFEKALNYYLPQWYKEQSPTLSEAYSGNRPKLFKNNEPLKEFTLIHKDEWIHLLGIESPGLTAAPALANKIKPWI